MLAEPGARVALDQHPRRPDHLRHDHQHLRRRHHRVPEPAHQPVRTTVGRASSPQLAACPRPIDDIPVIGWLLDAFLAQGPIGLSLLVSVLVLQILLFRSRWGLRTRAVGEHPEAAETVGIDVISSATGTSILGGIFAGLAGAYLTIEFGNSFQGEMTNGRGFIALAALIFGRWTPIGAFGAALLFTASERHPARRPLRSSRGRARGLPVEHPRPVLQRHAVHHHDHHPGRRRGSIGGARRRRPPVQP